MDVGGHAIAFQSDRVRDWHPTDSPHDPPYLQAEDLAPHPTPKIAVAGQTGHHQN